MLSKQVQLAEVQLVAKLAAVPATMKHLLEMKVGDVIPLDIADDIAVEADGVPIFGCRYGTLNGRYAIKVNRILAVPPQENMLGD